MNRKKIKSIEKLENWDKAWFASFSLTLLLFSILLVLPVFSTAQQDSLYSKANKYYEQKQFDSAAYVFNQLVQQYPQSKEGYYNRGLCWYRLYNYELATQDFDTCLRLDSSFKDAHYMKALSLQSNGYLKPALNEFERSENKSIKQRINCYQLSVLISKNWYYMVAIMFIIIILFAVVAKGFAYKRG